MILPLARNNHPVWKQKFKNLNKVTPEVKKLAADMRDTLELAGGVGLAAPQVGMPLRLFIVNFGKLNEAFLNPKILSRGKSVSEEEEGCLSLPRTWGYLNRPTEVKIEYLDLKGRRKEAKLSGYYARIVQHEHDHLSSVFFADRVSTKSKLFTYNTIKIVFFGTPKISLPTLYSFFGKQFVGEYSIPLVVTVPDKKSGRGNNLSPAPVRQLAERLKIETVTPEKIKNNPEFIRKLKDLKPDFLVLISYGKILPKEILEIPKKSALNIHFSLLPKYRGPSPIQAAILNGDKNTGISVFKMTEKVDEGDIIASAKVKIEENDTTQSLAERLSILGADLVNYALHSMTIGKVEAKRQNNKKATYTKIISKTDGSIDIKKPPSKKKLDRMIRAYYPWPGVWTNYKNKRLKLLPEKMVQLEGKRPVKLEDFKKGHQDCKLDW